MTQHQPVLLDETLAALHIKKNGLYLDATLGAAGHAKAIIQKGGWLLALEADPVMLALARENLGQGKFVLKQGNFRNLDKIAQEAGLGKFDGILFDLGISLIHYKDQAKGFSFENSGQALDMRLDPENQVTASDLLMSLRLDQLEALFAPVMGESQARLLARKIVRARKKPLLTVGDFLEVIGTRRGKTHPATKPFLALRLAVNSELKNLEEALPKAFSLLKKRGRLVVISFHSLEDALVKSFFKKMVNEGQAKLVNNKPILPQEEERAVNPSARSAKLRVLEKK